MRKLKTADIFAFCRCLKQIGIKDKVQQIAKEADSAADAWSKGFDLLWGVFDAATESGGEKSLYVFMAGPFETTPEALEEMDLADFLAGTKQLAQENDLIGFFKSAAALTK